jgi:hypothetical protein
MKQNGEAYAGECVCVGGIPEIICAMAIPPMGPGRYALMTAVAREGREMVGEERRRGRPDMSIRIAGGEEEEERRAEAY